MHRGGKRVSLALAGFHGTGALLSQPSVIPSLGRQQCEGELCFVDSGAGEVAGVEPAERWGGLDVLERVQ